MVSLLFSASGSPAAGLRIGRDVAGDPEAEKRKGNSPEFPANFDV
jgi:hypothetical protein